MEKLRYRFVLFTAVSLCLCSTDVFAQWGRVARVTLHRGQIAHSIHNPGMSGKKDNGTKLAQSSFSYPMGRNLRLYSGGSEREGWNAKSNSAGEGIWILSKTGGVVHGSYSGSRVLTDDVQQLDHDMATKPEAYLGAVHHHEWALALRNEIGNEAAGTRGAPIASARQTYWPSASGVSGQVPDNISAASIWNFRYGRYNASQSFDERVALGEFDPLNPPAWASALSEDDFPEVVGITQAQSSETGLKWTRKWYQWGHTDYDDFLINETVVENTSGSTHEGVYVVLENRLLSGAAVSWRENKTWNEAHDWARDDHVRSTLASNYLTGESRESFVAGAGKPVGSQVGKDLADAGHAMVYVHDGESDHVDNTMADVGDPYRYDLAIEFYTRTYTWVSEGYIQHGQYFGLGVVDALPPFNTYGGADPETYVSPSNNVETVLDERVQQPASISMWRYTSQTDFDQPSPSKDEDVLIYDTVTRAGYMDEPDDPYMYTQLMAFGPYTLAPGEKCKVVVAYVGGHAADTPKYADYKRYAQPFNVAWMNLYNGPGQAKVSFAERQHEIPQGEDVMFQHFQNAINAYNWGYDIPNQPPNVKLGFKNNLDGQAEIYWSVFGEDAVDPDYAGEEAKDLRGYRIYKSTTEYHGPWEFVTEVSFEDIKSGHLPDHMRFDPNYVFHTMPDEKNPNGIPLMANRFVSGLDDAAGASVPGTYFFTDTDTNPESYSWYSVRYYDSGHSDWNGKEVAALESAPGPSGGAIIGGRTGITPIIPMVLHDGGFGKTDSLFYPKGASGEIFTQTLKLENQSNYDLVVTNLSSTHPAFQPLKTTLSIPSGGVGDVDIVFSGQSGDLAEGALTIESTGGSYSLGLVEIASPSVISTFAGGGTTSFLDFGSGVALADANLGDIRGLAADAEGNVYVSGSQYFMVYRIDPAGQIYVFAGNETRVFLASLGAWRNYSEDGVPATEAKISSPRGLATDRDGNLYIADMGNNRVRKVDTAGIINTVAGNGNPGHSGDGGLAIDAALEAPEDVAIGPGGEIYVLSKHVVRKVDANGVITTVAGKGADASTGLGDGGPATEAYIHSEGIFVDRRGILYIADTRNNRIRKVDADGIIMTIVGDGYPGEPNKRGRFGGDGGPATLASLDIPKDLAIDGQGDLFVLDSGNGRVRKVDAKGMITTVAGKVSARFRREPSGDGGAALGANLIGPVDMIINRSGDLLLSTLNTKKIRRITGVAAAPSFPLPNEIPDVSASDFNGDGEVNFADFIGLTSHFGAEIGDPNFDVRYDLNADGQVGFADFLQFATVFGQSVQQGDDG